MHKTTTHFWIRTFLLLSKKLNPDKDFLTPAVRTDTL